jgi:hypothetical protein
MPLPMDWQTAEKFLADRDEFQWDTEDHGNTSGR